jgi:hypothetical protein
MSGLELHAVARFALVPMKTVYAEVDLMTALTGS